MIYKFYSLHHAIMESLRSKLKNISTNSFGYVLHELKYHYDMHCATGCPTALSHYNEVAKFAIKLANVCLLAEHRIE